MTIASILRTYYQLSLSGLQLDPFTFIFHNFWVFIGPLLVLFYFALLKNEFKHNQLAMIPVIYAPIITGILYTNSMLAFLPPFFLVVKSVYEKNYERAAIFSAVSLMFRPDGIFLLILSVAGIVRERGKLTLRIAKKLVVLVSIYAVINKVVFGNWIYHVALNARSSQVLNFGLLVTRIMNEPFSFLTTLMTLPLVFYYIKKRGFFRPYYGALLFFGVLNPQMLFEIGRWGGSSALVLFIFENREFIKKHARKILLVEGAHTAVYLFLKIRFLLSTVS